MSQSAEVVTPLICIRDEVGLNYFAKVTIRTGFMGFTLSIKANAEMANLH
jgi:hypothetical protein